VTQALALATFAVITWFSLRSTWTAWEVGDVTPTANITTWWSRAAVPVGSALLCLRLAMQLVGNLGVLAGRRGA
jgi:TRAP-type C4-dicarboxylate transport system permease small subunit